MKGALVGFASTIKKALLVYYSHAYAAFTAAVIP